MRHAGKWLASMPYAAGAVAAWMLVCGMAPKLSRRALPEIETLQPQVEQTLPKGSSIEQVLAFLNKHGVEHSGLVKPEEVITVELANTPDQALTTDRVQLQFWFHEGRLVTVNLRELFD